MHNRADYEKALVIVGSVVRAWDPYCLLEGGAPSDEFDAEIAQLVTHIPRISTPADAAQAISTVFSAAFEPGLFTPAQCAELGQELFARLVEAGLVSRV
jgi:Domain of unknown function (DUF1871)